MARLPLVSPLDRALFLKAQPYLDLIGSAEIAAMALYAEERFFSAGQLVFREGVRPDTIYFLASGAIRTRYPEGARYDLHAPGGVGLLEHLARSPVPPVAWTLEDTLALAIDVGRIAQFLEEEFSVWMSLSRALARNAREAALEWAQELPPERGFPDTSPRETFATLDLVHRLAQARKAPFFEGSNLTVLTELLRYQEARVLAEGEALFREGDEVASMALILDGAFRTRIGDVDVAHPAGAMIGGWEMFTMLPRIGTSEAVVPSRVIEIERTHFTDVLEDHFQFSIDYLGKLARRVIELRNPGSHTRTNPGRGQESPPA